MKRIITKIIIKLLRFKPATVGVPVIIQNSKKEILLGKRSKNAFVYPEIWGLLPIK